MSRSSQRGQYLFSLRQLAAAGGLILMLVAPSVIVFTDHGPLYGRSRTGHSSWESTDTPHTHLRAHTTGNSSMWRSAAIQRTSPPIAALCCCAGWACLFPAHTADAEPISTRRKSSEAAAVVQPRPSTTTISRLLSFHRVRALVPLAYHAPQSASVHRGRAGTEGGGSVKKLGDDDPSAPVGEWQPLAGVDGWSFRPRLALDLQQQFFDPARLARMADDNGLVWMAADVATSIQLSKERFLWVFGDTFVGKGPDKSQWSVKGGVVAFPRQTVATVTVCRDTSSGKPPITSDLRFTWRTSPPPATPPPPNKADQLSVTDGDKAHTQAPSPIDPAQSVVNMFDPHPHIVHPPPPPPVVTHATTDYTSSIPHTSTSVDASAIAADASTASLGVAGEGVERIARRMQEVRSSDGGGDGSISSPPATPPSGQASATVSMESSPSAAPATNAPTPSTSTKGSKTIVVPGVEPASADASSHAAPWYWVICGIRPRCQGPLFLLGSVVELKPQDTLGFDVSCTGALVVKNPDDDPQDWVYDQVRVPGTRSDLNWFAGVAVDGPWAYLVGQAGSGLESRQVLARLPVEQAMELDFTQMEVWASPYDLSDEEEDGCFWLPLSMYLADEKWSTYAEDALRTGDGKGVFTRYSDISKESSGVSMGADEGSGRRRTGKRGRRYRLKSLFGEGKLGVTELSLVYDHRLERWVMATVYAFDKRVLLWTGDTPTGPWTSVEALNTDTFARVESTFQSRLGHSEQKQRMYYSAKIHPELSSGEDIVLTYCANAVGDWPAPIDYTPRFFRVQLRQEAAKY